MLDLKPNPKHLPHLFGKKLAHELNGTNVGLGFILNPTTDSKLKNYIDKMLEVDKPYGRISLGWFKHKIKNCESSSDPDILNCKLTFLKILKTEIDRTLPENQIPVSTTINPLVEFSTICRKYFENSFNHRGWIESIDSQVIDLQQKEPSDPNRIQLENNIKEFNEIFESIGEAIAIGIRNIEEYIFNKDMDSIKDHINIRPLENDSEIEPHDFRLNFEYNNLFILMDEEVKFQLRDQISQQIDLIGRLVKGTESNSEFYFLFDPLQYEIPRENLIIEFNQLLKQYFDLKSYEIEKLRKFIDQFQGIIWCLENLNEQTFMTITSKQITKNENGCEYLIDLTGDHTK